MIRSTLRKARTLPALLLLLLYSASGFAVTYIDAQDGHSASADISVKEATLLKVEGGRFLKIRHNAKEILVDADVAAGVAYVKPVTKSNRPITVFVQTERATFPLVLRTVEKPADTIFFREPAPKSPRGASSSSNYVRTMKNMILAAAMEQPPADYQVTPINRAVPLWKEARYVHFRQITGPSHIIDHYVLTNATDRELVLNEQEFFKRGVVAASIENATLAAGESTSIYVVRRGAVQ